jgi:hypothetical protein
VDFEKKSRFLEAGSRAEEGRQGWGVDLSIYRRKEMGNS